MAASGRVGNDATAKSALNERWKTTGRKLKKRKWSNVWPSGEIKEGRSVPLFPPRPSSKHDNAVLTVKYERQLVSGRYDDDDVKLKRTNKKKPTAFT